VSSQSYTAHCCGHVIFPNFNALFAQRRNYKPIFIMVDKTPSHIPGPSTERVDSAWKPTLLSVTGVAKEGGEQRKLKLQYKWWIAQCNNHTHK
jgi:hypothetical protein